MATTTRRGSSCRHEGETLDGTASVVPSGRACYYVRRALKGGLEGALSTTSRRLRDLKTTERGAQA